MQRELGRFTTGTQEEQYTDSGEYPAADSVRSMVVRHLDDAVFAVQVDGAELPEGEHDARAKGEVTNAVDDEGFLGGVIGGTSVEVVPIRK